jgi:predicted nuclease of predicted toxin-antitoxin system
MKKYLIDANLPYHFSLWNNEEFIHVFDIDDEMTDEEIWNYAKENDLIIVTKDADFTARILLSKPPPKVIHLKIGNMRIKEFHTFINRNWALILNLIDENKLVKVFNDRIETG